MAKNIFPEFYICIEKLKGMIYGNFTGVLQCGNKHYNTQQIITWHPLDNGGTVFEYTKTSDGYNFQRTLDGMPVKTFTEKFLEADNNGTCVSLDTIA